MRKAKSDQDEGRQDESGKPCGGKERCGHSSRVDCALSSVCSNQIYGISPTRLSPFKYCAHMQRKGSGRIRVIKIHSECVYLARF
jgi:hypothetical protein